jgi:hypothetical protein
LPYLKFRERAAVGNFTVAGLVHMGEAVPPETALQLLGSGYHGVIGEPEGLVYRYEDTQPDTSAAENLCQTRFWEMTNYSAQMKIFSTNGKNTKCLLCVRKFLNKKIKKE